MVHVLSSSIEAVGYDPARRELTVRFAGGGTYAYEDVPRAVYDALLAAESKGRYVNGVLKPGYAFRRVSAL
jgi:hypothetical protein